MSDDQQPQAVWVFPEKPKRRAGRIWLIIGLVVAVLIIAGAVLFFVIPRNSSPAPSASPTPSSTPSATPSATPPVSPSASPLPTDVPSEPVVTPPPAPDPDVGTFAGQVRPWLDDATTGLSMLAGMGGQDAVQVVDSLQGDADRLAGAVAPGSLTPAWYDTVSEYSGNLRDLRSAIDNGGDTNASLNASSASLQALRSLVGL